MVKMDNGKDEDRSQSPDLAQMCKKPKLDSFQVDLSDAISYEEDYDDSNPRYNYKSTYFVRSVTKQYIEYQKYNLDSLFPEDLIQHQLPPQLHKICI